MAELVNDPDPKECWLRLAKSWRMRAEQYQYAESVDAFLGKGRATCHRASVFVCGRGPGGLHLGWARLLRPRRRLPRRFSRRPVKTAIRLVRTCSRLIITALGRSRPGLRRALEGGLPPWARIEDRYPAEASAE
jgi:hypothetical protein